MADTQKGEGPKDKNKSIPEEPKIEGEYPYVDAHVYRSGKETIVQNNPINKLFTLTREPSGKHTIEYPDGSTLNHNPGKSYKNADGGTNVSTAGNKGARTDGSTVNVTKGGTHEQTGKNKSTAVQGKQTTVNKSSYNHSQEPSENTSKEATTSHRKGNQNLSVEGNIVQKAGKVHVISSKKDVAVYSDEGAVDVHADKGKARLYAKKEILIESDEKITLKVGKSEIIITKTEITIKSNGGSGNIKINK